jgi:hypothetical protein
MDCLTGNFHGVKVPLRAAGLTRLRQALISLLWNARGCSPKSPSKSRCNILCAVSLLIKSVCVMTEAIRSFWHGPPLNPYLLLCLHSFAERGYPVEIFTYEGDHGFPAWIAARDARDVLPGKSVMVYRRGPGAGSPALHANLFRLVLLERHGGWWVDTDVALLAPELPSAPIYFAAEEGHFTNAIMKFPRAHPLLTEAAKAARAAGDDVPWATTGPTLLTRLIRKHGLDEWAAPSEQGCPFIYTDVLALFDPARAGEMMERARSSFFMHLNNEIWRRAGIPTNLGPPEGSFLDLRFRQSGLDIRFPARIELGHLATWLANAKFRQIKSDPEAEFTSYRTMVEHSRWSRLGRWLRLGPIARDWEI